MKQVTLQAFGDVDQLHLEDVPTPDPETGQVRVKLTSIGLNHAELMGRRGEYKLSTGDPPLVLGLEGGGVIDAVGEGVDPARVGQRVILSPDAPRPSTGGLGGTYRSHYVLPADRALPAPDAIPDQQLGAIWLPYLTAYGCLIWKHDQDLTGKFVALPAASSSTALAAAQIVKRHGGTTVGLTTSESKVDRLRELGDLAPYDHLIVTHDKDADNKRAMRKWHRDMRDLNSGNGMHVFFDPVASGKYLATEILCLAQGGSIYVYGLLGEPDVLDVSPLIRKRGKIEGWVNNEIIEAGETHWRPACDAILRGFADGAYKQHVDHTWPLDDVQTAHAEMEKGRHVGKLVLTP
jgi:NADPH:quinone reductase